MLVYCVPEIVTVTVYVEVDVGETVQVCVEQPELQV